MLARLFFWKESRTVVILWWFVTKHTAFSSLLIKSLACIRGESYPAKDKYVMNRTSNLLSPEKVLWMLKQMLLVFILKCNFSSHPKCCCAEWSWGWCYLSGPFSSCFSPLQFFWTSVCHFDALQAGTPLLFMELLLGRAWSPFFLCLSGYCWRSFLFFPEKVPCYFFIAECILLLSCLACTRARAGGP